MSLKRALFFSFCQRSSKSSGKSFEFIQHKKEVKLLYSFTLLEFKFHSHTRLNAEPIKCYN